MSAARPLSESCRLFGRHVPNAQFSSENTTNICLKWTRGVNLLCIAAGCGIASEGPYQSDSAAARRRPHHRQFTEAHPLRNVCCSLRFHVFVISWVGNNFRCVYWIVHNLIPWWLLVPLWQCIMWRVLRVLLLPVRLFQFGDHFRAGHYKIVSLLWDSNEPCSTLFLSLWWQKYSIC